MAIFDLLKTLLTASEASRTEVVEDPLTLRVVLLLETAGADYETDLVERKAIETLLTERYGLSQGETEELMVLAAEHHGAVHDVYQVTRSLAAKMSLEERKHLMTEIWEIIFADGRVDMYEEHFARKMQKMLRLDHPTWIETKLSAARQQTDKNAKKDGDAGTPPSQQTVDP